MKMFTQTQTLAHTSLRSAVWGAASGLGGCDGERSDSGVYAGWKGGKHDNFTNKVIFYFTRTKPFDDAEMLSCSTEELLGCGAGREISISEDNTAAGVPEQK